MMLEWRQIMRRLLLLLAFGLLPFPGQAEPSQAGQRLLLTFLGDIMAHTVNFRAPDYAAFYRPVRWLLERDTLTFANLESPVDPGRECSTYPRFNVGPAYVRAASEAGIEVFSLANNHAYDQGAEGVARTLGSLEALGRGSFRRIHYSGLRTNPSEPFRPVEIVAGGARIGFLAATQALNTAGPEGLVLRVDYQNEPEAEAFLEMMRAVAPRYDLFVLSYHGGREFAREPERARVRFFRRLVAAGVDIVYGHHPHVLQRYELVDGGQGRGLILYSAGNFISGMTWSLDPLQPEAERAWTGDSMLWVVSVVCSAQGGSVEQVWPVPITNVRDSRGVVVVSTFPGLATQTLTEPWTGFYRERSRRLQALLREWEPLAVDPCRVP
jgi:poly-gamma-glutamate synthesis protein (capsule biosynthesis protein)